MISNPGIGFEIEYNEEFIDEEALKYSKEFKQSLINLIFNAGEEFIHLFTMSQKNYEIALEKFQGQGIRLYVIGKAIYEEKLYFLKDGKKIELKVSGFEQFK